MPKQKANIEKLYFTIGEVAEMLGVTPSSIRYWENHFEELAPQKNTKGTRQFSHSDIEILNLIHHLVKEKGMTIKGARSKLKFRRQETVNSLEILRRLQDVKEELIQIKNELED